VLMAVATATLALVAQGCGGNSGTQSQGSGIDGGDDGGNLGDGTMSDVGTGPTQMGCSTYPGHDPTTLPGSGCCSNGPSHCVPKSDIPPALDNAFATCSGGLCVPDPIISKGSEYVPATCQTKILSWMLPGVCLSECITLVSSNPQKGVLHKETCGQGELCVPCNNPLTMMPTGACSITNLVCGDGGADGGLTDGGGMCPYNGPPLLDAGSFPACSPACNGAHCVPAALVPPADQSQLAACSSMGSPGFCAPDKFIESGGNGLPKTCTSVAGSEGRCLSTCLPGAGAALAAGRVRIRRAVRALLRPGGRRSDQAHGGVLAGVRQAGQAADHPQLPVHGAARHRPQRLPGVQPGLQRIALRALVAGAGGGSIAARQVLGRLLRARLGHLERRQGRAADVHVDRRFRGALSVHLPARDCEPGRALAAEHVRDG
jgi:hypothetical protein